MRLTGADFLLFAYYCCIAIGADSSHIHVKRKEHLYRQWTKREIGGTMCQDSKLIVNPTSKATYLKIVTDDGETLFSVDSTITVMGDLDNLLTHTTLLFFPEAGRVLKGNNSDFYITKKPSDNGVEVKLVDIFNSTIFGKEIQESNKGHKALDGKCAHLTGFKVIVDPTMDVNQRDGYNMTALVWAALLGEEEIAKDLVHRGADVNSWGAYGATPLGSAVSSGKEGLVEYLIQKGAKVNAPVGLHGASPLHIAAYKGRTKCAKILLDHGANISSQDDSDGGTPLHYAASEGQLEVLKQLVAKGADIKAKTKDGMTALHMAALIGNEDLIHYLIQSGAEVNSKDNENSTPLMKAISIRLEEDGILAIVKHLIEHHNADVSIKDNRGETVLSRATAGGYRKVQDYLKAHGAI